MIKEGYFCITKCVVRVHNSNPFLLRSGGAICRHSVWPYYCEKYFLWSKCDWTHFSYAVGEDYILQKVGPMPFCLSNLPHVNPQSVASTPQSGMGRTGCSASAYGRGTEELRNGLDSIVKWYTLGIKISPKWTEITTVPPFVGSEVRSAEGVHLGLGTSQLWGLSRLWPRDSWWCLRTRWLRPGNEERQSMDLRAVTGRPLLPRAWVSLFHTRFHRIPALTYFS